MDIFINLSLKHRKDTTSTDLKFWSNEWEFLVALILSIRSRDNLVNQYMKKIEFKNSIQKDKLNKISLVELEKLIFPFGLRSKALTLKNLAKLPQINLKNMNKIKGIGPKIIDVYSNVILKENNVSVDTHTWQFFKKFFKNYQISLKETRKFLNNVIESPYKFNYHIIMVRWNKHNFICENSSCIFCLRLLNIFL